MADFWSSLTAPFTGAPIEDAARAQQTAIMAGMGQQAGSYASGQDALRNYYTSALSPYAAMQPIAQGGYQAYADASGAAGREGQLRAQQAFTTDPGYLFAQKQMEDAVQRSGAAGGVAIGNRTADVMDRTQGLASRAYGDYVNRLAPWLGQGLGVAGGMAGINMGLGGELNRSYDALGNAQYAGNAAFGNARATELQAPMTAGSNIWNLGLNLGKGIAGSKLGQSAMESLTGMFGQGTQGYYGGSPETNPLLKPIGR